MSIMELGALGEFVAAIAVLITLIYLAVQVKQTRDATLLALEQSRTEASRDIRIARAESRYLNGILEKVQAKEGSPKVFGELVKRYELTPEEANRLANWFWVHARNLESQYRQGFHLRDGESWDDGVAAFLGQSWSAYFWKEWKAGVDPVFREHVDKILENEN